MTDEASIGTPRGRRQVVTDAHRLAQPESGPTLAEAAPWHTMDERAVLAVLDADPEGLANGEARARLARHGPNALPAPVKKSALQRILAQFNNLLIFVLMGSAVVTAALGHPVDTAVIVGVVILNAIIGFIQEGKAEEALEAIRGMVSPKVSLLREGRRVSADAADVVPGDILLVEAGDRVGADVRLIKVRNLRIDEAILTGESVAVEKSLAPVGAKAPLGDQHCMAFSGTLVTAGQGTGVVVATGPASELGRISAMLRRVEQLETPLIRQMNAFARQLTFVILALAAVTLVFAVAIRGYAVADAFMAMVGMAVAAIPEGLPAVMTITLAIGVQRMAARNAIVRRLPAVETLGSVSTICSDKTGTLTRNEMMVTSVVLSDRRYDVGGVGYAPRGGFSVAGREADPADDHRLLTLAQAGTLCNDASLHDATGSWHVDGDPMEGALVVLGMKAGHDQVRLNKELHRIDEIPFDAEHRYMATLHRGHGGTPLAYVKGAPEEILRRCRMQAVHDGEEPIDREYWSREVEALAGAGRRVLALASRPFPGDKRDLKLGDVDVGLTLLGLVGLIDPPRPEVVAAIAECHTAGIAVKMITGDHVATAAAIARELGLEGANRAMTGLEIEAIGESDLRRAVGDVGVFARASPEHKLRLVEAMQAGGAVIAMTGDGVNDAPALKRAEVGVAMGKGGTEAAKEAADMVLADDNFASIVAAVKEGRTVYDNLTKVIGWTLPTNGGETLIIVGAILVGLALPMTAVQILWINMVTAVGLGLVLAFEPPEGDIMRRAPRDPAAPILSPFLLWRVVLVSVLFAIGAFGMFYWAKSRGLSEEAARTIVVNTVVVMEIFYLFSVRYLHGASVTWIGVVGTPAVLIGVGGVALVQIAFTYVPVMQRLFGTADVGLVEGAVILAVGVALLLILEVEKKIVRALYGQATLR